MPKLFKRPDSPYWWVRGYDAKGREWRQSTKQKGRRAAERVGRSIEAQRLDETTGATPVSLREAMAILREHKERKGVRPATLEYLRHRTTPLLRVLGAERNAVTLTLADCERYVDRRREEGVSDHTIAKDLGSLREALRVLRRHDLFHRDPRLLKPESLVDYYTPGTRWLTVEEYRKLLLALGPSHRKYVVAYVQTGVRASELYRAERDGDLLLVQQHKGKTQTRIVPLSADAVACFDEHPLPWRRWSNPGRDLKSACDKAEIEKVCRNDLRRTFCSWLAQAGVPELTMVRLMGHANSNMIRLVYAQLAPATLADAVARMPRVTTKKETA